MAHAQKPDFVFRAKRTSPFKSRGGGASVQSTAGTRGVRISGTNAGYTMFRGSVKGNGYPLRSPVSPSLPLPCVTVCNHISSGVYQSGPVSFDVLYVFPEDIRRNFTLSTCKRLAPCLSQSATTLGGEKSTKYQWPNAAARTATNKLSVCRFIITIL